MLRRPSPEYQAVPHVLIVWVLSSIDKLVEHGIDSEAGKFGGEEFGFLLGVSGGPMGFVA